MKNERNEKNGRHVVCHECGAKIPLEEARGPAQTHSAPSRHEERLLLLRNVFAIVAAAMFIAIVLLLIVGEKSYTLYFVAYGLGAMAYLSELVVLYLRHEKHPSAQEILMPVMFGVLYILMAVIYLLSAH